MVYYYIDGSEYVSTHNDIGESMHYNDRVLSDYVKTAEMLKTKHAEKTDIELSPEHLFEKYMMYGVQQSHQFCNKYGIKNIMDIIQYANFGLYTAAINFNPDFNTQFCTYASFWIWKHMRNHHREDMIQIEGGMQKKGRDGISVISMDGNVRNSDVDPDDRSLSEVMDFTGILSKDYFEIMCNDENDGIIDRLLNDLDERDKTMIVERFGINGYEKQPLCNLAEKYGYSIMGVDKMIKRNLYKMRNHFDV